MLDSVRHKFLTLQVGGGRQIVWEFFLHAYGLAARVEPTSPDHAARGTQGVVSLPLEDQLRRCLRANPHDGALNRRGSPPQYHEAWRHNLASAHNILAALSSTTNPVSGVQNIRRCRTRFRSTDETRRSGPSIA
jgi:hypothetical protein